MTSQDTRAELDAIRGAINRTAQHYVEAWNRHDAEALAGAFVRDADFTNAAGVHMHGRQKVQAFHAPLFEGLFKGARHTAIVRNIRVLSLDLAAVDLDWEMDGLRGPDGQPRPVRRGLMNWVMCKTPDGPWLILIMHNAELASAPR